MKSGTKKTQPKLTAALIMKDAAETIVETIESLDFCDEIVIVDTGSSDGSIERAKGVTIDVPLKVFLSLEDWGSIPFHFGQARNEALSYVEQGEHSWVLSIDADEIAICSRPRLDKVLARDEADIFSVNNLTSTVLLESVGLGSRAGRSFKGGRLFKNNGKYHWAYRVHEMIQPVIPGTGRWAKDMPGDILQLRHRRGDITDSLKRNLHLLEVQQAEERAKQDEEKENYRGNGMIKTLMDKGQTYNDMGKFVEAVGCYEMLLKCLNMESKTIAGYVYYLCGCAYYNFGAMPPAIFCCSKAIDYEPDRIGSAIMGAQAALFMGEEEVAKRFLYHAKAIENPIRDESWPSQAKEQEDWIKEHIEKLTPNVSQRAQVQFV